MLTVDGRPHEVEVDLDRRTVTVDSSSFPIEILDPRAPRFEAEIGGESVVVERPASEETPHANRWVVNGEVYAIEFLASPLPASAARPESAPRALEVASAVASDRPLGSEGVAVVPPMPGKIVEVRVREGDEVEAGRVVLILEAMKMRNEVTAPVTGKVVDVRVVPGANVRAREPMLRIVPR